MSMHMKVVLGLSVAVAAAGFLSARQSSISHGAAAETPSAMASAHQAAPAVADTQETSPVAPADLALTRDSVEALRADNNELEARIAALEAEKADADRLIALKTTRLQALEKQPGSQ